MAKRHPTAPRRHAAKIAGIEAEISQVCRSLVTIHAVIMTSVAALQRQAADSDADIALCLMRCGADPVSAQADRLASLVSRAWDR